MHLVFSLGLGRECLNESVLILGAAPLGAESADTHVKAVVAVPRSSASLKSACSRQREGRASLNGKNSAVIMESVGNVR